MPSLDDVPFDLDGSESDTQGDVNDIFSEMGFTSWRDVFAAWEDADPQDLRGARYLSPEEALFDLYDRGMLGFSDIVYYPDEELYSIAVDYEE